MIASHQFTFLTFFTIHCENNSLANVWVHHRGKIPVPIYSCILISIPTPHNAFNMHPLIYKLYAEAQDITTCLSS